MTGAPWDSKMQQPNSEARFSFLYIKLKSMVPTWVPKRRLWQETYTR